MPKELVNPEVLRTKFKVRKSAQIGIEALLPIHSKKSYAALNDSTDLLTALFTVEDKYKNHGEFVKLFFNDILEVLHVHGLITAD